MDKKSLDEFFAQAEDVLTNWPVKNVNDSDAANTEDPGRYELGDEDGTQPRCPYCGHRHPSFVDLLGDFLAVVFLPPETEGPELMMFEFDPAVGVAVLREDGAIEVVEPADPEPVTFDILAWQLTIPPESR